MSGKSSLLNYKGIIVTVLKSMSMIFVMSATVFSYAMDRQADQVQVKYSLQRAKMDREAYLARTKSSFQRAAQELQEEEERMFDGKVPEYKESELEKELKLSKTRKKTKFTW